MCQEKGAELVFLIEEKRGAWWDSLAEFWVDGYLRWFTFRLLKFMHNTDQKAAQRIAAERLADIFTSLQRNFIITLSKELGRGNVSFPQFHLLGFLTQQDHLTMTEIAHHMGHTTAAATGLVDRLEKLGHAKRTHATDDRRKILVRITPSGAALVLEVRNDMVENLLRMMAHLEPQEQKAWLEIYEKIFPLCQKL